MKSKKRIVNDIQKSVKQELGFKEDDQLAVYIYKRKKYAANDKRFVMVFQDALELLFEGSISKSTFMIIVYLWKELRWSNHLGIDQTTIAEKTSCSLPTVKKSIQELKKIKFLVSYPDPQDHRRSIYFINPNFSWKGEDDKRKKASKFIDENQLKLFIDLCQEDSPIKKLQK